MWRLSNEREIYEGRIEGVCVTIGGEKFKRETLIIGKGMVIVSREYMIRERGRRNIIKGRRVEGRGDGSNKPASKLSHETRRIV